MYSGNVAARLKLVRVGSVDAAQQGLHQSIVRLAAQPTPCERADAFVTLADFAPRHESVRQAAATFRANSASAW